MEAGPVRIAAHGQLTMPDAAWEQARSRAAVIGSLAAWGTIRLADADRAAVELGVSRRSTCSWADTARVLVLLLILRCAVQLVARVGTVCLSPVEEIIRDLIRGRFLTRQKRSVAAIHREIACACAARGLKAPIRDTVARRISMLNPVEVGRRREGADAVRPFQAAGGDVPVIGSILEQMYPTRIGLSGVGHPTSTGRIVNEEVQRNRSFLVSAETLHAN